MSKLVPGDYILHTEFSYVSTKSRWPIDRKLMMNDLFPYDCSIVSKGDIDRPEVGGLGILHRTKSSPLKTCMKKAFSIQAIQPIFLHSYIEMLRKERIQLIHSQSWHIPISIHLSHLPFPFPFPLLFSFVTLLLPLAIKPIRFYQPELEQDFGRQQCPPS